MTNTTDRIATTSTAELETMLNVIRTCQPDGFYIAGTPADEVFADLGFPFSSKGREALLGAVRAEIDRRSLPLAPVPMRLKNCGKGRDFDRNNKTMRSRGGVYDARTQTWTVPDGEFFREHYRKLVGLVLMAGDAGLPSMIDIYDDMDRNENSIY